MWEYHLERRHDSWVVSQHLTLGAAGGVEVGNLGRRAPLARSPFKSPESWTGIGAPQHTLLRAHLRVLPVGDDAFQPLDTHGLGVLDKLQGQLLIGGLVRLGGFEFVLVLSHGSGLHSSLRHWAHSIITHLQMLDHSDLLYLGQQKRILLIVGRGRI